MKTKHSGSLLYGLFDDRLSKIKKDPIEIKNMANASETEQVFAVKMKPEVIQYIPNSCEKARLLAVTENPRLILKIDNPSIPICIVAVQNEFGPISIENNDNVIEATKELFKKLKYKQDIYEGKKYCAYEEEDSSTGFKEMKKANEWFDNEKHRMFLNFLKRVGIEVSPEEILNVELNKIMLQYAKDPKGDFSHENVTEEGFERWNSFLKGILNLDRSEKMQLVIAKTLGISPNEIKMKETLVNNNSLSM